MSLAKRRPEQENVFTTNNTRPNQKINRLNQTALFLTQGLTTAALQCTVKPLFFFFRTKSQPFNKKQPTGTINHIKKSQQTIPATIQSVTPKKQNITSKHEKLSHQSNVKSITKNHNKQPTSLNQKRSQNKPL